MFWLIVCLHEDVKAVSIFMHGTPNQLQYSRYRKEGEDIITNEYIETLKVIKPEVLMLYSCNAGHCDYENSNPASSFSKVVDEAPVVASDGSVCIYHWWNGEDGDER